MNSFWSRLRTFFTFLIFFIVSSSVNASWRLNMVPGVTPVSREVYRLHMTVFWICVAIGVVVFSVLIYTLIYHRKSRGVEAAQFHEHTAVEITWAIIPFIILIVMAVPATKILMEMNDEAQSDLSIKITGYQWKWRYEYLNQGISFFSNLATPQNQLTNKVAKGQWYLLEVDKPLVVPIHRKIRFLLTANDVIHSWWVPELGIKRDALPGFINETWARIDTPGTYRGQCAELCGTNHGFMPIVVQAVPEEEFDQWVAQQTGLRILAAANAGKKLSKEELMKNGEAAYKKTCAVCHQENGGGMPPAFPALKGSNTATGAVKDHINVVMNGRPGTAMQAFGPQLSDDEISAIITYERNAWGNDEVRKNKNDKDDLVQAADIAAARK